MAILLCAASAHAGDPVVLDTVVVTGSRVAVSDPDDLPVPVQIIDRQEIEDIGAITMDQVLEASLGIDLVNSPDKNTSPGFQTLRMRGMDASNVLILVDGKRLAGSRPTVTGQTFTDVGTINVDMIERIEILRDGASAQYGADAVAGVINIVTRKFINKNTVVAQAGISGEGDGEEGNLSLTGGAQATEKLYCNYGFFGKMREHYDRVEGPRWDSPDFSQVGAGGSLELEATDDQLLTFDWRYSLVQSDFLSDVEKERKTDKEDIHGGLLWNGDFDGGTLEAGYSLTTQDIEKTNSENPDYTGDLDWKIHDAHINGRIEGPSFLTLFAGSSFVSQAIDSTQRSIDETRDVSALFTEVGIQPTSTTHIQLSARYEHYSDFGDNTAPKIAARQQIIPGLSLRGSFSQSHVLPSLFQLHDNFSGSSTMDWLDLEGNPDLESSEGTTFSAGLVFKPGWKYKPRVTLDLYRNRIDNMIDIKLTPYNDGSGRSKGTYINTPGTSTFDGAEVMASTDLPLGFSLDIKANALEAKDPDGHDLTNRPRSGAMLRLDYTRGRFKGNARYNYRGKYLDHNREEIEPFDYVNMQVSFDFTKAFTLYAGARNLFDEVPPLDASSYEAGHIEGMKDSNLGAFYYAGARISW